MCGQNQIYSQRFCQLKGAEFPISWIHVVIITSNWLANNESLYSNHNVILSKSTLLVLYVSYCAVLEYIIIDRKRLIVPMGDELELIYNILFLIISWSNANEPHRIWVCRFINSVYDPYNPVVNPYSLVAQAGRNAIIW